MTAKMKIRLVRGLRLVSTLPGYWKLESDPSVLFQFIGKARLGPTGARYSVDRWLAPDGEVSTSLDAAVKRYLAKSAQTHATMKTTTVTAAALEDLEGKLSAEIRALPIGPARVSPHAEWLNLAFRVVRVARGHDRAQRGSSRAKAAQIAARIADGEDVAIDDLRRIVLSASKREFLARGTK